MQPNSFKCRRLRHFGSQCSSISAKQRLRDVEEMLTERGINVSYETVHRWANKFGPAVAANFGAHCSDLPGNPLQPSSPDTPSWLQSIAQEQPRSLHGMVR